MSATLPWQAACVMADHVGRAPDVEITIAKSIPVAGGMAGGSADAAAVLVAMNELWELGVPRRDLHAMAAKLGSDVPFALHGGTALGTDAAAGNPLLSATPSTGCWRSAPPGCRRRWCSARSTGCARLGSPARLSGSRTAAGRAVRGRSARDLAPRLGNDLQPAALSLEPNLRRTRCGRAPKPGRWPESSPGPDRPAPSCAPRPRTRWRSAVSWPGPGWRARYSA